MSLKFDVTIQPGVEKPRLVSLRLTGLMGGGISACISVREDGWRNALQTGVSYLVLTHKLTRHSIILVHY